MGNKQLVGIVTLILLIGMFQFVVAIPTGPDIENKGVENGSDRPATSLTTTGGTIATLVLNATTQNPHWKAYVGNVTGTWVLEDANNYSIYEWSLSTIAGEVYVTRDGSITWGSIECANSTHISAEETIMNHTSGADDSINNTFILTTHDPFWTGDIEFTADECDHTLLTYVNDTTQTSTENFQEILLYEGSSLVYTTLLEDSVQGFDLYYYDFQLIVAENGVDEPPSSTPYYFYVELA